MLELRNLSFGALELVWSSTPKDYDAASNIIMMVQVSVRPFWLDVVFKPINVKFRWT